MELQHDLEQYLEGKALLVDKPLTYSSFQAVNRIKQNLRRAYNLKKIKIGHAGTLDPLASGLLIVCTGKFTKRISEFQGLPKTYTGTFRLGATTPSYDLETEVDQTFPTDHITDESIAEAVEQLSGTIEQAPPNFSALRQDGERLYKKARRGEEVEIKKRKVEIHDFTVQREGLDVHFSIECSKGTYIRSMAHDFGQLLGSGAHLTALRRTKIGDFDVAKAFQLDDFVDSLWKQVKSDEPST